MTVLEAKTIGTVGTLWNNITRVLRTDEGRVMVLQMTTSETYTPEQADSLAALIRKAAMPDIV